MFIPQEIIRKKRDNLALNKEEIAQFVKGISANTVTDSQISAFTMAVFFRGLSEDELINLTLSMRDSGEVMNWSHLNGPVVDKHSTGGIGDLVSLILAPAIAACGAYVPMIVGRGLGHTGGTSDKLEAITGYNTEPSNELFKQTVQELGFAIMGQSKDVAPADKRIYAVRDTTATTESLYLITSSILSKKLASGLQSLVMDIKTGNGAFLTNIEQSLELAQNIVKVGKGAGCNTSALITDMSQPLSNTIGNAVEMKTVVDYLHNSCANKRLHEVNLALGSEMLIQAGIAENTAEATEKLNKVLNNGKAAELFGKMIAKLGGPTDFMENSNKYLQTAKVVKPIYAKDSGFISQMDAKKIGMVVVGLGGGRINPSDKIDHSVGLTEIVELGQEVNTKEPIAMVHARNENEANYAEKVLLEAITTVKNQHEVVIPKLICKYVK